MLTLALLYEHRERKNLTYWTKNMVVRGRTIKSWMCLLIVSKVVPWTEVVTRIPPLNTVASWARNQVGRLNKRGSFLTSLIKFMHAWLRFKYAVTKKARFMPLLLLSLLLLVVLSIMYYLFFVFLRTLIVRKPLNFFCVIH